MFIPGRLHNPLASLDDKEWQSILGAHPFWRNTGFSIDDEHKDLAFHILMHEGELADGRHGENVDFGFNAVPLAKTEFLDPNLRAQTWSWQEMHARNFGSGVLTKMGLYVIRAGGTLGFHVDGPVILKGMKTDLSQPKMQRAVLEMQASHRTIMPLRFNPDDQFMICDFRVPLQRGELFEFSNVVPHAYFNRGTEHAVMLVTTYLSEACLPKEVGYIAGTDLPQQVACSV
jgi:hypothetical protein